MVWCKFHAYFLRVVHSENRSSRAENRLMKRERKKGRKRKKSAEKWRKVRKSGEKCGKVEKRKWGKKGLAYLVVVIHVVQVFVGTE